MKLKLSVLLSLLLLTATTLFADENSDLKLTAPNQDIVLPQVEIESPQDIPSIDTPSESSLPNVVLIIADDLGIGDVGCYFGDSDSTPQINKLAEQGVRFEDFSVPLSDDVFAQRAIFIGKRFAKNVTDSSLGLIAQKHGFQTAFYGQWLLGTTDTPLPLDCGFDDFWGTTRSVENWSFHPIAGELNSPLKVWKNRNVVGFNLNPDAITEQICNRTVQFIKQNKDYLFLVCAVFPTLHAPLSSSNPDAYKNAVKNLDEAVGKIVDTIDSAQLDKQTIIIFLSDNGPNLAYGIQAGKTGPYRDGKFTCFEGGVRIPCIIRYNDVVKSTVYPHFACQLDLLPTIAQFWNISSEELGKREGKSLVDILTGKTDKPVYKSFAYYSPEGKIIAVRANKWKLYCPQSYKTVEPSKNDNLGVPIPYRIKNIDWELYDLSVDPGEKTLKNKDYSEIIQTIREAIKL